MVLVVAGEEVLERPGRAHVGGVAVGRDRAVGPARRCRVYRVLGAALLVAAPARVAQQVHRLEAVAADVVRRRAVVVQRAQFDGDRLGEDLRLAEPVNAVQRLRAGAQRRDAEAPDGRRVPARQRDPLGEREPPEQVVGAPVGRRRRGAERMPGRGQGRRTHEEDP
ncbi:hypothetical protein EJC51_02745 [Streptomyces aquilus]|uniref:Uncharacterized protein n=1 Tax=Streptomyces aquilus TaxID=2548456 RepID=A0A3Q9BV22_9ACTN|nr:hypothetical protein EJC51_02745 [Streptomyces aquilus]